MLTATITNTSGDTIVAGSLPAPFDWAGDIANNGTLVCVVRVQDMDNIDHLTGFSAADMMQQLVQMGKVTISFANLAATKRADVDGDAVANET